jgi:hypothetical protein
MRERDRFGGPFFAPLFLRRRPAPLAHRARPSITRACMPSIALLNFMTKLIQNGFKYTFSGAKRHESCIIGNQFYKISY